MLKIKSIGDSGKELSKSTSRKRQSQECKRRQCSNSITDSANHIQLKRQNAPRSRERFEKMIRRKKSKGQHSTISTASGRLRTDTLSKEENLNEMEFDVTQWHNTLWTKRNKHPTSKIGNSSFVIHGDDCFKETVVGSLAIDANSPFAKEIPEEAFDERAEKGSYLMRPGAISIGIDCLELASALTAIIILLFTIDLKGWNALYPLCNTVLTTSIVIWLIITHSFHLYLKANRNEQGVMEYYIPISKKYMFLHEHIVRCILTLTSIAQAVYFSVVSAHRLLFHLITIMLIIHFCCAFIHLYFSTKDRFILSLSSDGSARLLPSNE